MSYILHWSHADLLVFRGCRNIPNITKNISSVQVNILEIATPELPINCSYLYRNVEDLFTLPNYFLLYLHTYSKVIRYAFQAIAYEISPH